MISESKRPLLVRQHSIASFLLQSFAAQNPNHKLWGVKGMLHAESNFGLFATTINNKQWRVMFKGGRNLQDSIGHLKSLIKETIDIYKRTGNIDERNLTDLVWQDAQKGMLQVEYFKQGKWEAVDWRTANLIPSEVTLRTQKLISKILKPIGSLFDMATMRENYMDGTSRKLSLYDMVSQFQNVKNEIRWAGLDWQGYDAKGKYIPGKPNELYNLTEQLLSFLGTKQKGAGR